MKTKTPVARNSISLSPLRHGLFVTALILVCFPLSPQAHAVCEEGCDLTNFNTFLGDDALSSNTSGISNTAIGADALRTNANGGGNTAIGVQALQYNTDGSNNTASGFSALRSNTTGYVNTATGDSALQANTTGHSNTATGFAALATNSAGSFNTAIGSLALQANTSGTNNTATGYLALETNTTGTNNTANGYQALANNSTSSENTANGANALFTNKTGSQNTADGSGALFFNRFGNFNTAVGRNALYNNKTGALNIALGYNAGFNATGRSNIDIGNDGVAAESNTIRIGTVGTHTAAFIAGINGATVPSGVPVIIDTDGHLGTTTSSTRYKENIQPMDKASEAILSLQPVTFHYTTDATATPQFGLIAEEVAKVNHALVLPDKEGKPYTVRYEAVNAMLLNEFLKEHRTVQELKSIVAKQETTAAQQQKQIDALSAGLQKVSAQLELSKSATRTVQNSQ